MTLPRQRPQGPAIHPAPDPDGHPPAPDRRTTSDPANHPASDPTSDPGGRLPFRVTIDDSDTPYDVVDALLLTPFTTGLQPHARHARLDALREDATLVARYNALKLEAAAYGVDAYRAAKSSFILDVLGA